MALVLADRVRETTTTTGTGSVTLAGAYTGFQTFSAAIGNANDTYYTIANIATGEWEVGIGTYTSSGNILSRDTVLSSSNAGSLVVFSAGTKDVFVTQPAERAVYVNAANTQVSVPQLAATSITNSGTTTLSGNQIISVTDNTNAALLITQLGTGNALLVEDSANPDSSPFVIDATGTTIIGNTAPVSNLGLLQIHGTSSFVLGSATYQNNANANVFQLAKSRGTSAATYDIVQNNDELGSVRFVGADGTAFIRAAQITSAVDGTPGTNDMPGRLVFSTTADGASTPTERMRINNAGNVGIGLTPTASVGALQVTGNIFATSTNYVGAAGSTAFSGGIQNLSNISKSVSIEADPTNAGANSLILFNIDATERMRIDSAGNVGIGTTAPASFGAGFVNTQINGTTGSFLNLSVNGTRTGYMYSDASGTEVGNLTNGYYRIFVNGSERARIDSSGNVGIGTSSPTSTLSVTGTANVTGNVTLGDASTDTVTVNGYMGVGGAPSSFFGLTVSSTALTGTNQVGFNSQITGTSAATNGVFAFRARPQTAAASFTVGLVVGLLALDTGKGAGSTITDQHGVRVEDQTQGTNNYGITSLVSSGTNKFNIYASGTAANYFAGQAQFANGSVGTPSISNINDTNTGIFFPSADQVAITTGGTQRAVVDASGNVGIGTSSPACVLDVVGGIKTSRTAVTAPAATDGNVFSGTYTPSLTNTTNIASSTAAVCQYMRVGNVVTVSGTVTIDPTATGRIVMGLSLPIASALTAANECGGTFASAGTTTVNVGSVAGDATNDRATFDGVVADAASRVYGFSFTYSVI
jgi:hypothetical protein